jgi:hypothetical protein
MATRLARHSRRWLLGAALGAAALVLRSAALEAQAKPAPAVQSPAGDRCRLELVSVGDSGRAEETAEGTNYFAGGGVKLRCRGTQVSMQADSVAHYGGRRTEFIGHVRYRDSTLTLDAERGTYFREGERWEARGAVRTQNLRSGSTLRGPSLDYFRRADGVRDTAEMFAIGRPTVEYGSKDSTGTVGEPYVIVGDRIRVRGEDQLWAGGKVTINRSDFAARGDSLRLDTGAGHAGTLLASPRPAKGAKGAPSLPVLRGLGADSFELEGRRIDFALRDRELERLTARGAGHAINTGWNLRADTIQLAVKNRKLQHTDAWGDSIRPHAVGDRQEIRADSLALDTPGQRLSEARAFGKAWVAQAADSATHERDWLVGDTVVARFASRGGADSARARLKELDARRSARAFYQARNRKKGTPGAASGQVALNYVRGDAIHISMRPDSEAVDRVDVRGAVDGVQLEPSSGVPSAAPVDSAASPDSAARTDSTVPARPRR